MSAKMNRQAVRARAHGWLCQGKRSQEEIGGPRSEVREPKADGVVRMIPCERCKGCGWVKEAGNQDRPTTAMDPFGVPCPLCKGKGWKGEVL